MLDQIPTGAPAHPPHLTCRKCAVENPMTYLAPVALDGRGTCICLPCARSRGWLDRDDNLRPGITL